MNTSQALYDILYGALHDDLLPYVGYPADESDPDLSMVTPIEPKAFAARQQLLGFGKRYLGPSNVLPTADATTRESDTIANFRLANSRCRKSSEAILASSWTRPDHLELILQEASQLLYEWFTAPEMRGGVSPDPYRIGEYVNFNYLANSLKCGPGASRGTPCKDFYGKTADGPRTASSRDVYRLYRSLIDHDPTACATEVARRRVYGDLDDFEALSSLSTVPKTRLINRTICTEPSTNMELQLATGLAFGEVLKRIGINIETQQDVNRSLALLGSRDGSLATIDLRWASDTISSELVKRLFIHLPDWFWLMDMLRSKATLYKGDAIELSMFSTMGNGFTFPLQTLIFSSIVCAVYKMHGVSFRRWSGHRKIYKFSVFGDDIIVKRELYDEVITALELCGFLVNKDKSFGAGPFRESCGADWYRGEPCRPCYIEQLDNVQDRIGLANRLNRWSCETGLPVPRAIHAILESVPKEARYPVPSYMADLEGVHVPADVLDSFRWPRRPLLSLRRRMELGAGSAAVLAFNYWKQDPSPKRTFWKVTRKGKTRQFVCRHDVNWDGVLLAVLQGCVMGLGVTLRRDDDESVQKTFSTATGITPGWACLPEVDRLTSVRVKRMMHKTGKPDLADTIRTNLALFLVPPKQARD